MIFLAIFLLLSFFIHAENRVRIQSAAEFKDKNNAKREVGKVLQKYTHKPILVSFEEPPLYLSHLIDTIYKNINGFLITQKDEEKLQKAQANSTYGEITSNGICHLISELQPTRHDLFYDLGCGVGRFNLEIFARTPIAKSIGIELADGRYALAKQARKSFFEIINKNKARIEKETVRNILNSDRKLEFRNQNMLEVNWREAMVPLLEGHSVFVYLASTCMTTEFLNTLTAQLITFLNEVKINAQGKKTGSLILLTLKKIQKNPDFQVHFKKAKTYQVDMSWSDNVDVYQYRSQ